ncbi:MAG: type IV secretory system conjugative DNA transfer family protein [Pseudomonadota bacterium]
MLTRKPGDLFTGFVGGTPVWYSGSGGGIVVAGARGGKLRDWLGYNVCTGICSDTLIILDPKNEAAEISKLQVLDQKYCLYWPRFSFNPVSYICIDSPTLVSDVKVLCDNIVVLSGGGNAQFFEKRGRQYLESLILIIVEIDGVLTLPRLYHAINALLAGGEDLEDLLEAMKTSQFDVCYSTAKEIASSQNGNESSGYRGIIGELAKAFAPLSDPVLLKSVSPPFDFSIEELIQSGKNFNFYMTPPAAFLGAWSAIIKIIMVSLHLIRSRNLGAPRQTWLLDEAFQLKSFPLLLDLYSIAAGEGCRVISFWQSSFQMRALGPDAENIITASAELRCYFSIRDLPSANTLSQMLGTSTLEFDDVLQQSQAEHARKHALESLMAGESLINAGLKYDHYQRAARIKSKQQRLLRTPSEILHTPRDRMYVFMDALPAPLYAQRAPYYEQYWMAGRFHPNPFYKPNDRVRISTLNGHEWRRVIEVPVPPAFADYPQYADGMYSYIEGFKP